MQKILIIKTGTAGDVVRTTSLLNVFRGDITWVVDAANKLIFPDNYPGLRVVSDRGAIDKLHEHTFDKVLSLEENEQCARLASTVKAKALVGVYLNQGGLTYNEQSAGWFDMSLISKKGREKANELKQNNALSFQQHLFNIIGKPFANEPYLIYKNSSLSGTRGLVGIEARVGTAWPNKAWTGYVELSELIKTAGYQVKFFGQRQNLRDYFDDIGACSCIISGDTLAMHVAMAYKIPCIGLFNCTPPQEINGYGYLTKMASPMLHSNLYSRNYDERVVSSIPVIEVFKTFSSLSIPK